VLASLRIVSFHVSWTICVRRNRRPPPVRPRGGSFGTLAYQLTSACWFQARI